MNKKLNGYAKWAGIVIAISTIIFSFGITYQKVNDIGKDVAKIEQRLEKIEDKLWIQRSTE